jgi:hypothetical protein
MNDNIIIPNLKNFKNLIEDNNYKSAMEEFGDNLESNFLNNLYNIMQAPPLPIFYKTKRLHTYSQYCGKRFEIDKTLILDEKSEKQLHQFYDIKGYSMFENGILSFITDWINNDLRKKEYVFENKDKTTKINYPLIIKSSTHEFYKRCGANNRTKKDTLRSLGENKLTEAITINWEISKKEGKKKIKTIKQPFAIIIFEGEKTNRKLLSGKLSKSKGQDIEDYKKQGYLFAKDYNVEYVTTVKIMISPLLYAGIQDAINNRLNKNHQKNKTNTKGYWQIPGNFQNGMEKILIWLNSIPDLSKDLINREYRSMTTFQTFGKINNAIYIKNGIKYYKEQHKLFYDRIFERQKERGNKLIFDLEKLASICYQSAFKKDKKFRAGHAQEYFSYLLFAFHIMDLFYNIGIEIENYYFEGTSKNKKLIIELVRKPGLRRNETT